VTFLASFDEGANRPVLVRGTYQSPILVQWQPVESRARRVDLTIADLS
jgi:hypothetical protein